MKYLVQILITLPWYCSCSVNIDRTKRQSANNVNEYTWQDILSRSVRNPVEGTLSVNLNFLKKICEFCAYNVVQQ